MTVEDPPAGESAVSVVIPTYNHAEYVLATIDSVRAQTVRPFEIIVVNDGATDDTEDRLAELIRTGAIRYVRQANAGQAAARNAGAALAHGTYLLFLDDDDILPPDSLEWRLAVLEAGPSLTAVFASHVEFGTATPPDSPPATGETREITHIALFAGNPAVTPGQVLIRRSAFERVGGFTEEIWGADDWDLWFKLASAGRLLRVDRCALYYRIHPRNASRHAGRLASNVSIVLERHLRQVPSADRGIVRYLSTSLADDVWRPRLRTALAGGTRGGRWRDAVGTLLALLQLGGRRVAATIRLKAYLILRGRFRLDPELPVVVAFAGRHPTPGSEPGPFSA